MGCHGLGVFDMAVSLSEDTATPTTVSPWHSTQKSESVMIAHDQFALRVNN
jgi:hypothetical protein